MPSRNEAISETSFPGQPKLRKFMYKPLRLMVSKALIGSTNTIWSSLYSRHFESQTPCHWVPRRLGRRHSRWFRDDGFNHMFDEPAKDGSCRYLPQNNTQGAIPWWLSQGLYHFLLYVPLKYKSTCFFCWYGLKSAFLTFLHSWIWLFAPGTFPGAAWCT